MIINKNIEKQYTTTDTEYIERLKYFINIDVTARNIIDVKTRYIAILAALLGTGSREVFNEILLNALNNGVQAAEIKEIIYQATPYLGIGKVIPFIDISNAVFNERNIKDDNGNKIIDITERLLRGEEIQIKIFGEHMRGFAYSGEALTRHINQWLSQNCFGDYYTRAGLDYKIRELITFCFLMAQGGCEPQLKSHITANLRMGNDKKLLIEIVSQCLPFIGYPRALNAINCIKEIIAD